jgi:hypothetical protein
MRERSIMLMNTLTQSKSSVSLQLTHCAALALALAWLAGCASPGYKKSDAAAGSMSSAASEVQAESLALDVTRSSLNNLVENPPADLRLGLDRYSEALNKLAASAQRTENTGKTMARKSEAYFVAWDKQLTNITYEVIRNGSNTRKTEARGVFDTVNRRYKDTQAVVWPLITYLADIRQALTADLTLAGVNSVKPVVAHANANMDKVQAALAALATSLSDARTRFSSYNAPVEAPN